MLASKTFIPKIKDIPQDAEIISHQLMLRSGMIRKVASGIYNWLPLGLIVLKKIENVVREELNNIGAQEIFMPMVQPKELWDESNRWGKFGPELLRIKDRHDRDFCLGPTHEEVITDLVKNNINSYKSLPLTLYQIQTKFRDEIRPRYGVMRGREFLMKDAYSFHMNTECLNQTYQDFRAAYKKILERLELEFKVVKADSGAIGGDKSEEFHVLAENGEDVLAVSDSSEIAINSELLLEKDQDPSSLVGQEFPEGGKIQLIKGIEVGHIFQLGQVYSESMKLSLQDANSNEVNPYMGCYGIGISRMVAASIEQNNDEFGIAWPKGLAPIQINVIDLTDNLDGSAIKFYNEIEKNNFRVMLDDRDQRFGKKIKDSELIGIPLNIIIGKSLKNDGLIEVSPRRGTKDLIKPEELNGYIAKFFQES